MMRNFRLGLLLVSVAVLVIFIQQNLTPVLPLTFLGMKTVAFPLCLWILLGLTAGGVTSGIIFMLLKLQLSLNYGSSGRRPPQESTTGRSVQANQPKKPRTDRLKKESDRYSDPEPLSATASYESPSTPRSPDRQEFEPVAQWQDEEENWVDEEENWVDEPIDRPPQSARVEKVSPLKTEYEVPQEPINKYQSGSIYSYSYRSPENTGVGTSESVNDAEYRVIVPPSPGSEKESASSPFNDRPSEDDASEDDDSEEYASQEYASEDDDSEDDTSEDYASEDDAPETQASPSKSVAAPTPTPEPTSVYKTKVQPVKSTPTKIQTNDEDDWSQPSRNQNNDDW